MSTQPCGKGPTIPLDQIISEYGLPGLLAGAAVEGETTVVIGGMMVHRGVLPLVPAIAAAAAGSFLSDQLFFILGRRFRDHAIVRRIQRKPAFAKALSTFERHPLLFVFAFRFLYGLRTVSPIAIGTTQLPARTFFLVNAAAALVWGAAFVCVGVFFGTAIEEAFGRIKSLTHVLIGTGVVAFILWLVIAIVKWRRTRAGHEV